MRTFKVDFDSALRTIEREEIGVSRPGKRSRRVGQGLHKITAFGVHRNEPDEGPDRICSIAQVGKGDF